MRDDLNLYDKVVIVDDVNKTVFDRDRDVYEIVAFVKGSNSVKVENDQGFAYVNADMVVRLSQMKELNFRFKDDEYEEKEEAKVEMLGHTGVGKDGTGKDDRADGKLRWDLLPLTEIEDIVEVYTVGSKKYADNSWQDIPDGFNRYLGALHRHLVAYVKGERYDKEGFMHLAAVCWNAIALLHYDKHNKGLMEWKEKESQQ